MMALLALVMTTADSGIVEEEFRDLDIDSETEDLCFRFAPTSDEKSRIGNCS